MGLAKVRTWDHERTLIRKGQVQRSTAEIIVSAWSEVSPTWAYFQSTDYDMESLQAAGSLITPAVTARCTRGNMRRIIASLLTALMAVLLLSSPMTATNADGANTLSFCNLGNLFAGGIEVYNLENQQGGSRVWCVRESDVDNHFGGFPNQPDSSTVDIGSFNDKADSIRVRVNPGCIVSVQIYKDYGEKGTLLFAVYKPNTSGVVQNYDYDITLDNQATSGRLTAFHSTGCSAL